MHDGVSVLEREVAFESQSPVRQEQALAVKVERALRDRRPGQNATILGISAEGHDVLSTLGGAIFYRRGFVHNHDVVGITLQ